MKLRAVGDNVVIEQLKSVSETKSGIKLPEHDIHQGIVLSVGPDCPKGELPINAMVAFSAYSGTEVKVDGETYLILKYDDIVGTIHYVAKPPEGFHHELEKCYLVDPESGDKTPIGPQ